MARAEGIGGGASSPTCSSSDLVSGICGSAEGVSTATPPIAANLCNYTTTAPTVSGGPSDSGQPLAWSWSCTGSDPGNASLTVSCGAPVNAQCSTSGAYNTANGGANSTGASISLKNSCMIGAPASESDPTNTSTAANSTWTCLGSAATAAVPAGQSANCTFYNYILIYGQIACGHPPDDPMLQYNAYCCGQPDAGGGGVSLQDACNAVAACAAAQCGPGDSANGVQTPSCNPYGGAGTCSSGTASPLPPIWP